MVWLAVENKSHLLRLTEGTVPRCIQLLERYSRLRPVFYESTRAQYKSRDSLLAFILSAASRRSALLDGWEIGELDLHTWVFGPGKKDQCYWSDWFFHDSRDNNYRIIVHREPAYYRGVRAYAHFAGHGHEYLRPLRILHRRATSKELKLKAEASLREMLKAYSSGEKARLQFAENSGHSYCFSDGRY